MIGIVVVTHGQFGVELLKTAQDIVGRQERTLAIPVVSESGMEPLCAAIEEAWSQLRSPEGLLVLVDMLGGTPCNSAVLKMRNEQAEIITGVNLYMLISAFTNRPKLDLRALALKVAEDGRRAIVLPKDLLPKKAPS